MEDLTPVENPVRDRFLVPDLWIIVASCLIIALAPSFQSFWIDEGTVGLIASCHTYAEYKLMLAHMSGSEALMPLATIYFWLVEKVVGDSEWMLRLCNLPWLWFGIICMALAGKRIGWPWLPLLFAIHPVVWFYADEVRPYAIQLGMGSWLALGFLQILQSEGKQARGFCNFGLASIFIIAASFLGIFVVTSAGLILAIKGLLNRWQLPLKNYAITVGFAIVDLALAVYMLSKIAGGAAGSRAWTVGLSNLGFASYELLGFVGLGPGRELIRSEAATGGVSAASYLLISSTFTLAILFLLYLAWGFAAVKAFKNSPSKESLQVALLSGSVAALSVFCLLGAALESRFPFWGRHLTPNLPFILMALAGIASALKPIWPERWRLYLIVPFFAVLLYSSCVIRWSPTHAKDDYRTASTLCREYVAQGKRVAWIAANGPAFCYHVRFTKDWPPFSGTATALCLPAPGSHTRPDIIIVSKPDLFDRQHFLPGWINLPGVTVDAPCQSFVVYHIPPAP